MANLDINITMGELVPTIYGGDTFAIVGYSPTPTPQGSIVLTMDAPVLEMSVRSLEPNSIEVTMGLPTLSMRLGNKVEASMPLPTLSFQVTTTILQRYELELPLPTLNFQISSPVHVSIDVALPSFSGALSARLGNRANLTFPSFAGALSASITTGSIGRISGRLPTPTVLMTVSSGSTFSFAGELADIVAGPSGRIVAVLPMPRVEITILGTAGTYEAYAINLKHVPVPGVEPLDEVSRYTNYPFNQILRYKDQYYGVASDGIYLLSGVTDNGTAITWTWKTALEDDNVPEKKTVRSAYFSGRVGQDATITVYSGESGQTAYTYNTPRDANPQNYRKVFGRGVKGKYYAIGASGASTMELDTLELEVDKLTRKI